MTLDMLIEMLNELKSSGQADSTTPVEFMAESCGGALNVSGVRCEQFKNSELGHRKGDKIVYILE